MKSNDVLFSYLKEFWVTVSNQVYCGSYPLQNNHSKIK